MRRLGVLLWTVLVAAGLGACAAAPEIKGTQVRSAPAVAGVLGPKIRPPAPAEPLPTSVEATPPLFPGPPKPGPPPASAEAPAPPAEALPSADGAGPGGSTEGEEPIASSQPSPNPATVPAEAQGPVAKALEPRPPVPGRVEEGSKEPKGLPIPNHPAVASLLKEFSGPRRRTLALAFQRGERYLPMIRRVLREEGLPEDLAYLALVESHFKPDARSPAGAVGMWQFIESTARASGLRVDWWVDERLDPELATRAAARHLKELYALFDDWDLALAAYNAGPGAVGRALRRCNVSDFWGLLAAGGLRSETCRYVPKFYAAVSVARNPKAYGLTWERGSDLWAYDTVLVDSPVDVGTVARLAGVDRRVVEGLNPALLRGCTPPGSPAYPVRVPVGKGNLVATALERLPPERRLAFKRYRVEPGDTLWGIARRFGTRVAAIRDLNRVRSARRIRPGQDLVVPVPEGRTVKSLGRRVDTPVRGGEYRVKRGDTLWGIARRFGTTVARLQRWNSLAKGSVLRPGRVLRVEPAAVARGETVHVVEAGDTLWGIARRYGVDLRTLLRVNGLRPNHVLRPGDELRVPVSGSGG